MQFTWLTFYALDDWENAGLSSIVLTHACRSVSVLSPLYPLFSSIPQWSSSAISHRSGRWRTSPEQLCQAGPHLFALLSREKLGPIFKAVALNLFPLSIYGTWSILSGQRAVSTGSKLPRGSIANKDLRSICPEYFHRFHQISALEGQFLWWSG